MLRILRNYPELGASNDLIVSTGSYRPTGPRPIHRSSRGQLQARRYGEIPGKPSKTGPMYGGRWQPSRLHMGPVSVFVAVSFSQTKLQSGHQHRSPQRLRCRHGCKQRGGELAPVISSSWRSSSWRPSLSLQLSLPFSLSLPCRPLDIGNIDECAHAFDRHAHH